MYQPPTEALDRYADVIVNCGLGNGMGIGPGEVVLVSAQEDSRPLQRALIRAIYRAGGELPCIGGMLVIDLHSRELETEMLRHAPDEQFDHDRFPKRLAQGLLDAIGHHIFIISDQGVHAGIDPLREQLFNFSLLPFRRLHDGREQRGRLSHTVVLYPTEQLAQGTGRGVEEFWTELGRACFLRDADPVEAWRRVRRSLERIEEELNGLGAELLHIEGEGIDLRVRLGPWRQWITARGKNLPSFEVYTSPDWRGTEGVVEFDQPYRGPTGVIEGVRLVFREGRVAEATARRGQELLDLILEAEGGDRLGEIGLTDGNISPIEHPVGHLFFDENVTGSLHLALGRSLRETHPGDSDRLTPEQWETLGYNESAEHVDLVVTRSVTVTATLPDGSRRVVFAKKRIQA